MHRNNNKKGKGKKKVIGPKQVASRLYSHIVKGINLPSSIERTVFWRTSATLTNTGNNYANYSFAPTDPKWIDNDQSGAVVNLPYWTAFQNMYRFSRTLWSSVKIEYGNSEQFPVVCAVAPSNKAVGYNTANFDDFFDNASCKTATMGTSSGNGTVTLYHNASTADFGGSPLINSNDPYCCSTDPTGTRPGNYWYWFVGMRSTPNFTTAGVLITFECTMKVRFFELQTATN